MASILTWPLRQDGTTYFLYKESPFKRSDCKNLKYTQAHIASLYKSFKYISISDPLS